MLDRHRGSLLDCVQPAAAFSPAACCGEPKSGERRVALRFPSTPPAPGPAGRLRKSGGRLPPPQASPAPFGGNRRQAELRWIRDESTEPAPPRAASFGNCLGRRWSSWERRLQPAWNRTKMPAEAGAPSGGSPGTRLSKVRSPCQPPLARHLRRYGDGSPDTLDGRTSSRSTLLPQAPPTCVQETPARLPSCHFLPLGQKFSMIGSRRIIDPTAAYAGDMQHAAEALQMQRAAE